MQITELVWKLFLLLLPGVLATLMLRYISTNKQFRPFEFAVYSAVLAIGLLITMELFYSLWNILSFPFRHEYKLVWSLNLNLWDSIFNTGKQIPKIEIFLYYLLSFPFGFIIGLIISKKILIRILQKTGLTKRYGDNDVWSYYLNLQETDWVTIRDQNSNLAYFGQVKVFSDSEETREIVLQSVDVYESDSWTKLYSTEAVYLELEKYHYSIESPIIENNNG
jgi:hypothetical protein